MSAETESIILGVIALVAGIGTAVAIRKKTARIAVACCIGGGAVMLLYVGLDRAANRQHGGDVGWREREERLRAKFAGEASAEQPQSLVVLPNGTVVRSNAVNLERGERAGNSRDIQGNNSNGQGMRTGFASDEDDSIRGKVRRRPVTPLEAPNQPRSRGLIAPPMKPTDER